MAGCRGSGQEAPRLNCISHLLGQLPHEEVQRSEIVLSRRIHRPEYVRVPAVAEMIVPELGYGRGMDIQVGDHAPWMPYRTLFTGLL